MIINFESLLNILDKEQRSRLVKITYEKELL